MCLFSAVLTKFVSLKGSSIINVVRVRSLLLSLTIILGMVGRALCSFSGFGLNLAK